MGLAPRLHFVVLGITAAAASGGFGCGSGGRQGYSLPDAAVDQRPFQNYFTNTMPFGASPRMDILLVIDDAPSMSGAQANLHANVTAFANALAQLPGGVPDLHLAVVTGDMGAGDGVSIAGCSLSGDAGVFRSRPSAGCASTGLDPGATFISTSGGANPRTNFGSQDLASVLACLADVGSGGCPYQQPLGAAARALGVDNSPAPPESAGFLRSSAHLAIVVLAADDDCSQPPGGHLLNPVSTKLASMYGPTQPFICNEWGHKCLVPPGLPNVGMTLTPSRYAPNSLATDTVTYTAAAATTSNCESFEDSPVLTAVGVSADEIKGLKADPYNQIAVAAVVGLNEGPDSNGYTVAWRAPPVADTGPWPFIEHACGAEGSATGYADPAVRIEQFAEQFGASGSVDSFCAASYGPSVAASLASAAGPPCIKGKIATLPNSNSPDCAVTELVPNPADPAHPTATDVPACAGHAPPCWSLAAPPPGSSAACTAVIALDLGTIQPPADAVANVNCNLCIPGFPEPSVGCP